MAPLGSMDHSGTNRQHEVPDALWAVLSGHRGHATSLDRLRGIVHSGAIEICAGYHGLCTSLGAVSLFDFGPTAVDIKSLGQWTQWCGSEQASSARRAGVPQKKVGVWLRVRDDYADERLIDAAALREIWTEKKSNVIPGVEGGHLGPVGVAALDQIVVIAALRLAAYRVWDAMPSAAVIEEVSDHIGDLPEEPLSRLELAFVQARQKREHLRSGARGAPGDARLVRRAVRSVRLRRSAGPSRYGEHGAASAWSAHQPQERVAASEATSLIDRRLLPFFSPQSGSVRAPVAGTSARNH